jgi:hypothetical protein
MVNVARENISVCLGKSQGFGVEGGRHRNIRKRIHKGVFCILMRGLGRKESCMIGHLGRGHLGRGHLRGRHIRGGY